jgi:hypothetical protein
MSKPRTFASVWDAIADTPEQAANPCARELMQKIAGHAEGKCLDTGGSGIPLRRDTAASQRSGSVAWSRAFP